MNGQFTVGTICEYQNLPEPFLHNNDSECEVIEPLETRYVVSWNGVHGYEMCYMVRDADGAYYVRPNQLRRKPPKATDTGEMRIKEMFTNPPVVAPVDRPIPELA